MEFNKTRIGLTFILVLLLFSVVSLVFWDFVRDVVITPVYYAVWVGNLLLKSISQEVYFFLFVIIGTVIGVNTIFSAIRLRIIRQSASRNFMSSSRYAHWYRLSHNLYSSSITSDNFVREARRLILKILAYQFNVDVNEIEYRIETEALQVPEVIKTLIQKKRIKNLKPKPQRRENIINRLRRRFLNEDLADNSHIDNPVNEIVAYIEHLLEIDNVTN